MQDCHCSIPECMFTNDSQFEPLVIDTQLGYRLSRVSNCMSMGYNNHFTLSEPWACSFAIMIKTKNLHLNVEKSILPTSSDRHKN